MPLSRLVLGLSALAMATTMGCSTSTPRLSFAVEQRILRETTLDDLPEGRATGNDAVVRVVRRHGACSGAVIGSRHILTAQHCVMKLTEGGELTTEELVAGDLHVALGGGYLPWGRVGVRKIHSCGGGGDDVPRDVAVLILSKPLPHDVPRFEVTYDAPEIADVLEASGFGSNEKPRAMPLTGGWTISSVERGIHRGPVLLLSESELAVSLASAPGDSGGPIIDVTTGRIASVVSKGTTNHDSVHRVRQLPGATERVKTNGPRLQVCKSTIDRALRDHQNIGQAL